MVQTLISERAQISNILNNHRSYPSTTLQDGLEVRGLRITINTSPWVRYTPATTRLYPSTTCWKVWKSGDYGQYHHLCILIQVLVRLRPGSYRREYRPLQNTYPLFKHAVRAIYLESVPLRLLEPFTNPSTRYEPSSLVTRPLHLLQAFLTHCKTPRTLYEPLDPSIDRCGPVIYSTDHYTPLLPATSIPSTRYKPLSLVTDSLRSSTHLRTPYATQHSGHKQANL